MFLYHFLPCTELASVAELLHLIKKSFVFLSESSHLVCFDHCASVGLIWWDIALASRSDWTPPSIASLEQLIVISLVALENITFHIIRVDLVAIFIHTLSAVAHLNADKL